MGPPNPLSAIQPPLNLQLGLIYTHTTQNTSGQKNEQREKGSLFAVSQAFGYNISFHPEAALHIFLHFSFFYPLFTIYSTEFSNVSTKTRLDIKIEKRQRSSRLSFGFRTDFPTNPQGELSRQNPALCLLCTAQLSKPNSINWIGFSVHFRTGPSVKTPARPGSSKNIRRKGASKRAFGEAIKALGLLQFSFSKLPKTGLRREERI